MAVENISFQIITFEISVKTARGKRSVCLASGVAFIIVAAMVIGSVSWRAYKIIIQHQFENGFQTPTCKY